MRTILEYIRLILFVGGAFIGVQIPSFVDQYGQRLESHLIESKTSIEGFQNDAKKYFNGDIEALIRHYASNTDPVINDGGESIASLHSRAQFLTKSWLEFNAGFHQRYWHAFAAPVTTIRTETWGGYDFAVKLNIAGISWALGLGLVLSMLSELILLTLGALMPTRRRTIISKQQAPTLHEKIKL